MSTQIPLRLFQQKGSYYVKQLADGKEDEIVLTVYSKPIASVFRASEIKKIGTITAKRETEKVSTQKEQVYTEPINVSTDDDTIGEDGFLKPGNPYNFDKMKPVKKWCGLNLTHPYTEPQDTYCITGEDENGNPVKHGKLTLVNIFGCAKCIESLPYTVMTGDTNG